MTPTISSMISIRVKFGAHIQSALILASITISVTVSYTLASPTPIVRAKDADSSADDLVRDMTPITSQFLTPINDCI